VVNGPGLGEALAQGEGDLAGAAGEIKHPAVSLAAVREIGNQRLRVWQPEAVVFATGALIPVRSERRVAHAD
jgi:hypothetical protein